MIHHSNMAGAYFFSSDIAQVPRGKLPDVVVVTHWVDTEQATLTKAALFRLFATTNVFLGRWVNFYAPF